MEVAIVFRPFSSMFVKRNPGWSLSLIIIAFKVVTGKASGQGASIQQPWYKTQCSRAVKEGYEISIWNILELCCIAFQKGFQGSHGQHPSWIFASWMMRELNRIYRNPNLVGTKKGMVSCRFFLHSMEDLFDIINSERRRDEQRAEAKVWRVRWR